MAASLCIFVAVCTVHYFWTLLQRPATLVSTFAVTSIWKITLAAAYRFGVAVGINSMMFLGLKEVWYFGAGYRLGIAYDDYLGVCLLPLTFLLLRRFEQTAELAAREFTEAMRAERALRVPVVLPKRPVQ
jgi:hypothetical protein